MPLLKRTSSNFVGKASSPDPALEHQAISFDEARDLVHAHLASAGLSSARGLHDDGTGGAHIGSTQLYYDYDNAHHNLTCSALVYHFRHHPSPSVVQAFRDTVGEIDTGGGQLLYEDENSGLYLTRSYPGPVSRGQFKKDMEHLLHAAREWSDMGAERAAAHLQQLNVNLAPTTNLPTAPTQHDAPSPPLVGKQSAARRAHQRSESVTPPLRSEADHRSHQQEYPGAVRTYASTPVSALPAATAAAAAAAATAVAAEQVAQRPSSPGLRHPRPVQARAVQSPNPRVAVVASAEDDEHLAPPVTPSPSIKSPSPGAAGNGAAKKGGVESSPSHETLFHKLIHKLPHRPHSPKTEEESRHHNPHPLYKLDPSEPRPSGMPLRIYSSSSPSRALWEQPPTNNTHS